LLASGQPGAVGAWCRFDLRYPARVPFMSPANRQGGLSRVRFPRAQLPGGRLDPVLYLEFQ
jgi:hypothetical protein